MPPRQRPREVWGGGTWLPQSWYDACDELGVLVYHDMQYAQQGHAPAPTQVLLLPSAGPRVSRLDL